MPEREVFLTSDGLRKLEDELGYLKTTKRKDVAARIKQAKEFGDLSENSEYEDAKNEQAFVEGRILTVQAMLRNARVITQNGGSEKVNLGSRVRLQEVPNGDEFEYQIVGVAEADPLKDRISNESPVGQALLGRRLGDVVEIKVPAGAFSYKIVGILQ
ncbi:MAG: transcription elongation factor GreA [Armatimonadetes bacterium]|nr:transcription elongation factor GreA [Armatimonadota bacterium]